MKKQEKQINFALLMPEEKLYPLERFHAGKSNRLVLSAVSSFGQKDGSASLVICGRDRLGKSHLLKGLSLKPEFKKNHLFLDCRELLQSGITKSKKMLKPARLPKIVLLDNLDAFSSSKSSVKLFDDVFHLFNEMIDSSKLFTATLNKSPAKIALMPDYLSSRLLSGIVVNLKKSNETERREILKKLAMDRQINLTSKSVTYILNRARRSTSELINFLDNLEPLIPPSADKVGLKLLRQVLELDGGNSGD